jgi:hypothetical protein
MRFGKRRKGGKFREEERQALLPRARRIAYTAFSAVRPCFSCRTAGHAVLACDAAISLHRSGRGREASLAGIAFLAPGEPPKNSFFPAVRVGDVLYLAR